MCVDYFVGALKLPFENANVNAVLIVMLSSKKVSSNKILINWHLFRFGVNDDDFSFIILFLKVKSCANVSVHINRK